MLEEREFDIRSGRLSCFRLRRTGWRNTRSPAKFKKGLANDHGVACPKPDLDCEPCREDQTEQPHGPFVDRQVEDQSHQRWKDRHAQIALGIRSVRGIFEPHDLGLAERLSHVIGLVPIDAWYAPRFRAGPGQTGKPPLEEVLGQRPEQVRDERCDSREGCRIQFAAKFFDLLDFAMRARDVPVEDQVAEQEPKEPRRKRASDLAEPRKDLGEHGRTLTVSGRAVEFRFPAGLQGYHRLMDVCIFCRMPFGPDRPRSEEHIWPKWMHSLLPEKQGAQRLFDAAELLEEPPIRQGAAQALQAPRRL